MCNGYPEQKNVVPAVLAVRIKCHNKIVSVLVLTVTQQFLRTVTRIIPMKRFFSLLKNEKMTDESEG